MTMNSTALNFEEELKYLVPSFDTLPPLMSSHSITQCYFASTQAQFLSTTAKTEVTIAGIPLTFETTLRQRATLAAILDQTPEPTIRLRQMDNDWYFTVKGLSMEEGTLEFEVSIPEKEGRLLVQSAEYSLDKIRHLLMVDDYLWEIDVYQGKLEGLITAEIENRDYPVFPPIVMPAWLGENVSRDFKYKNVALARMNSCEINALVNTDPDFNF